MKENDRRFLSWAPFVLGLTVSMVLGASQQKSMYHKQVQSVRVAIHNLPILIQAILAIILGIFLG